MSLASPLTARERRVERRSDGGGKKAGGAARGKKSAHRSQRLGRGLHGIVARCAVDVDVEEGRGESGIGEIDGLRSGRQSAFCARRDGRDAAVFNGNNGVVDETASIVEASCSENRWLSNHWEEFLSNRSRSNPSQLRPMGSTHRDYHLIDRSGRMGRDRALHIRRRKAPRLYQPTYTHSTKPGFRGDFGAMERQPQILRLRLPHDCVAITGPRRRSAQDDNSHLTAWPNALCLYGARNRHASHWTFSKDASVILNIIDAEEPIRKPIPDLEAMVEEGLVAVFRSEVIRYSHAAEEAKETPSGKT